MASSSTREAHELAGLLFAVVEVARRAFEALCADFHLSPVQARALLALDEPVPMRALAAELRCDPSNVTGLADRLEARGLVLRISAEDDRRVRLLATTAEGSLVRRALEAGLQRRSPIMAALSASERRTLGDLLAKMLGPQAVSPGRRPSA